MKVVFHPDMISGKISNFTKRCMELLSYNGIKNDLLNINDLDFWDRVKNYDIFIFHITHHDYFLQIANNIIPILENFIGIRCYPNCVSSWLYDNKIRQYYLLKQYNFPIAECYIFYDKNEALNFVETTQYPLVFKLKGGAGSSSVVLIKNKKEAKRYINKIFNKGIKRNNNFYDDFFKSIKKRFRHFFKMIIDRSTYISLDWQKERNYILFQKFYPYNQYDTRVVVIGNKACAFIRYNRPKDFRASGSKNYEFDYKKIRLDFIELAFKISKKFGFDTMAYDFIEDEDGSPIIVELSYIFGSLTKGSVIKYCPGYWDENLNWYNSKIVHEFLLLSYLLDNDKLKIPDYF